MTVLHTCKEAALLYKEPLTVGLKHAEAVVVADLV